ncbi:MAG TPA: hypothetical protein VFF73_41045 [Planctomycetota bacterium]|nr:hypothetical protein [Planctomycetota bacterium]
MKTKKTTGEHMIGARFAPDMIERLAAHTDRMKKQNPALTISQSDALRDLVLRGLEAVEHTA